jgi:RND family efflux transporter MFP subunit
MQPAPPPPQVSVAKPIVRDVVEWHEFTGRFQASDQVDIRSRIAGYIEEIHFKDGALVAKGDLLVSIDQRPTRFALEQAQAAMRSAQSRIEFTQRDLSRAEALTRTGAMAATIADQRRRDLQVAQADLQSAEAAAGRARLDLEYAQIRAPFAGRVSRKNASVGNLVKVDDTVLTSIVAVDPLHFYFDIDERSVLQSVGMRPAGQGQTVSAAPVPARIALADEPIAVHTGILDFVDNRLDEATGTLRMRAVVPNPSGVLQPGLFGRIKVQAQAPQRGVLLPDEAIASDQDRRIVYVLTSEGTAKATTVVPGPRIDGYRLIRRGLTGEETVVVNGLMRVRPGAKIAPKTVTLPDAASPPAPRG